MYFCTMTRIKIKKNKKEVSPAKNSDIQKFTKVKLNAGYQSICKLL